MAARILDIGRLAALTRRAGWGVADQALSSLTNFALSVLVARSVGPTGFGSFTLVFAIYITALGISRAIASEPLLVHYSAVPTELWRTGTARATGTALLIGVSLGLACLISGGLTTGPLGRSFIVLGLTLPGLLVQDCWRYAFFARGRGFSAFANDLVAALALLPVVLLLLRRGGDSVTWLALLGWGGAATVAALIGVSQAGVVPAPHRARSWWADERSLIPRFLGEYVAIGGASQMVVYVIGAIAGLAALGAFRAAYLVFGPIQVFYMGISAVAVPELVRALRDSPSRLLGTSRLLSLALMGIVLLWGAFIFLVPTPLGVAILGPMWHGVRPMSGGVMAGWIGTALIAGAAGGLRALAAAKQGLGVRILGSVAAIGGGTIGVLLHGATGAIWGLAVAGWLEAGAWWWQYLRTLRAARTAHASDTWGPTGPPQQGALVHEG